MRTVNFTIGIPYQRCARLKMFNQNKIKKKSVHQRENRKHSSRKYLKPNGLQSKNKLMSTLHKQDGNRKQCSLCVSLLNIVA